MLSSYETERLELLARIHKQETKIQQLQEKISFLGSEYDRMRARYEPTWEGLYVK